MPRGVNCNTSSPPFSILDECGLKYTVTVYENGTHAFSVIVDKSYYQPDFSWVNVSGFTGECGIEFLKEVSEWDAHKRDENSIQYTSVIKINTDKVQAIAAINNVRTYSSIKPANGNRKEKYLLNYTFDYKPVQGESIETEIFDYNGKVYCCIVPNGRIIVRDTNGFVSVCGNTQRRGAYAGYIEIDHGDFDEVCDLIQHEPDDLNVGWIVTDKYIKKLNKGNKEAIRRYKKALKTKMVTGKGYFFFRDKANRLSPKMYKDLNLDVKASNLCAEIMLHSDVDHTFTCVLSSMNLFLYDEWKDTDAVFDATVFLDCVAEEFIQAGKEVRGIENAVRFTEKGRALGLGACGLHSYTQQKGWAFEGFETHMWNIEAFTLLQNESYRASKWMAGVMGEPEWCVGYGMRNTHTMAVAPTKSCVSINTKFTLPSDETMSYEELLIKNNAQTVSDINVILEDGTLKTFKYNEKIDIIRFGEKLSIFAYELIDGDDII